MFSGKSPYADVSVYDLKLLLQRGERPSLPADDLSRRRGLGPEMKDLIQDCWTQEPTKRPSADEVVGRLQLLQLVDQRPPNLIETSFSTQVDSSIIVQNPTSDPISTPRSDDNILLVHGQRPEPIGSDYQAVHSGLSTTEEHHGANDAMSNNPQKAASALFKGAYILPVDEHGPEPTESESQVAYSSLSTTEEHAQDAAKVTPTTDPLSEVRDISN